MEPAQLAVVTGASSGIGLELARLFAADGYDLVVVADEAEIEDTASELADTGVHVEPVRVDLRGDDAVEQVSDVVSAGGARVPVAFAFNVGIGRAGRFIDGDLQADLDIVDVNVRSTVHLAKLVLRDMADRSSGRALFTSSIVAMMPGPTGTAFFRRAAMEDTLLARLPFKDDPAKTARQGYDAMMRGEQKVVASSLTSKVTGAVSSVLPDSLKAVANRLIVAPFPDR
jgi:short-subunit dehydrogenase